MGEEEYTTIRLSKLNRDWLASLGTVADDYDAVIDRLREKEEANCRRTIEAEPKPAAGTVGR
jgi:hypothetical protein